MLWRPRGLRGRERLPWILLAAGVVLLLRFPCGWVTNLLNEEAYYWMFAKHPALSYYDHPPMVAWCIRAGTLAAGETELGVRLVGLVLGAASLGLMYILGREWFGRRVGAWSAGAAWVADVVVLLHLALRLPGLPPVSQVHSWRELGRRVEQVEDEMESRLKVNPFVVGDGKSAIASELAFYMRDPHEEEWRHVTSQSVLGQAGRNYIYWSTPEDYIGRDALYVTDDDNLREVPLLRKAFASVESARTLMEVTWRGMTLRRFWVVECHGYLGVPCGGTGRKGRRSSRRG